MGEAGPARRWVAAVTCALALAAGGPARAEAPAEEGVRASEGVPAPEGASRWHLSGLSLSFTDSFLGVPRTRLNDDNGFVADLRVAGELSDGDRRTARLVASQQMITERGGLRRVDDGKIYLQWLRGPGARRGVTVGWMAGIDVVGDLYGSRLQNWAHQTVFTGRVLGGTGPRRLQDRYPRRTEILGMLGGQVSGSHPLPGPFSLRGGLDAAFGAGTGFFAEVHPYVALAVSLGSLDLELREGAGSYWTTIRALTMPGGYVTRLFQSQPSARLVLAPGWVPVTIGFELDWNSGNTSQHVGAVVLGARF